MTYRVGHHSTSDDSFAYRPKKEVSDWTTHDNPINRFRKYLESLNLWSEHQEVAFKKQCRADILDALNAAEKVKKPAVSNMFTDVYDEMPWNLVEQKEKLDLLMRRHPDHFGLEVYTKDDE
ncbi:hypothetical protein HK100_001106 [Physocladia obscura]|uniref:2-oxoisovalerate dehydrogenase subunit alpha n=1 Tax=Physocladia obscura TaxID=109957 RepID=A0AAD5XGE5_9FUNG|nr:hypothetical protein HK100_001106 [Physocladia obscura]